MRARSRKNAGERSPATRDQPVDHINGTLTGSRVGCDHAGGEYRSDLSLGPIDEPSVGHRVDEQADALHGLRQMGRR
jgi:hypothetical protein